MFKLLLMRQLNVTAQGRDHVNCDMIQNTARLYHFLKDQRQVRSHVHLLGGRVGAFPIRENSL